MEDFARRERPFPWTAFECLVRRVEGGQVLASTLAEAHALCEQSGLHVTDGKAFTVNWLMYAWVLHASVSA